MLKGEFTMRFDKLTIKAQEALSEAMDQASRRGNAEISSFHVLDALLDQEQGAVSSILQRLGVPVSQVRSELETRMKALPTVSGATGQPSLSGEAHRALEAGWKVPRA